MNEDQIEGMFQYGIITASRILNAATPFSLQETTELGGYAMLYYAVTGEEMSATDVVKHIDDTLCIASLKDEILRSARVVIVRAVVSGSLVGYDDEKVRECMLAFRFDMKVPHGTNATNLRAALKDAVYTEGKP